jgi:hypothetical protein
VVGFHRVVAPVLQSVRLELVQQADAASLLAEVQHHAATFTDLAERRFQLLPAIAFEAA